MTNAAPLERSAPSIAAIMTLIAAAAFGFWLALPRLRSQPPPGGVQLNLDDFASLAMHVLGGLTLVGPPLLCSEARRRRRRWGPGKFLWCTQGVVTWLMYPPIVYVRAMKGKSNEAMTEVCFFYGTPIMGLAVLIALIAGGRLRKWWRRPSSRAWRERFGMLLGVLWAAFGLYVLTLLYLNDFKP